jgi:hypothetical protein
VTPLGRLIDDSDQVGSWKRRVETGMMLSQMSNTDDARP